MATPEDVRTRDDLPRGRQSSPTCIADSTSGEAQESNRTHSGKPRSSHCSKSCGFPTSSPCIRCVRRNLSSSRGSLRFRASRSSRRARE
jgi:hypothetical protein